MEQGRTLWTRLVEPSAALTDPESRRKARLLQSLLVALIPLGAIAGIVGPFLGGSADDITGRAASAVALGSSALNGILYLIARTRHHHVAAAAFVAVNTAGAWGGFVAARADPNAGFILAFLAMGLVLSGILLSPMATIALAVVDFVGIAVLPVLLPDVAAASVVVPALFVGLMAFLVVISASVRRADTHQRQAAERELRTQEERYRNLVESSPDGIVLVSAGRIVYGNQSAARLFGAAHPRQLLGLSPLEDLVEPDQRAVIEERMRAIEQEGARTTPHEIRVRRLDGSWLDVEVMGAPAMHDGKPADQTIVRDITARKEAEKARAEIERLQEVNVLKTQLLNMASHELNTPIAALRLQLHMLKMGPEEMDPRRAKAMRLLDRNVERLAMLVRDVLDVARMQSGQLQLRRARIDLAEVVEEAAEFYSQAYIEKGVNLRVEAPQLAVDADPQRVMQVLLNLMSNALKFTPAGGTVRVVAASREDAVELRVEDTGPGLTGEQMAKLFQPFTQVHDASVEGKGGNGLGLHICRGILEQHGGRIWVESAGLGQGTTFAFSLPRGAEALVAA